MPTHGQKPMSAPYKRHLSLSETKVGAESEAASEGFRMEVLNYHIAHADNPLNAARRNAKFHRKKAERYERLARKLREEAVAKID